MQVGVSELAAAGPSLALIGARYCAASQGAGLLGVLGPLRMDYERAVTAATFLARLIGSPTE